MRPQVVLIAQDLPAGMPSLTQSLANLPAVLAGGGNLDKTYFEVNGLFGVRDEDRFSMQTEQALQGSYSGAKMINLGQLATNSYTYLENYLYLGRA